MFAFYADQPDYRTSITCERKQLRIECDEGTHINIIRANFGRFSISTCNEHGNLEWSVDCMAPLSLRVMKESCGMKRNCTVPASSGYFGDPCPGTQKYLEVQYQCAPDLPKKRSQSSKGPFRHQIKHQTPPPIVIPTRVENKATSDHNKNKSFPDSKSNADIDQRSKLNPADNEDEANKSLSSFSSTSSTPSSPPQFEFKNVDNDIYVRHPHPRFPDNNYAINQQNSRNNNFSTPAGVQGVEDNASDGSDINSEQHLSTKLISMTTETFSTDASTLSPSIDISTHCPPAESRNLFWNWTPIHLFASQPCPAGSKGTAKWYCSFYSSVPEWYPAEADLSDCVSRWVLLLEQSLNKDELSVTAFAGELAHMTRVKTLYGGDIQKVTDITNQLITRMEIGLDEFKDDELRSQFVKEVLNATQDICNSLFEDSKRSAWLDLPPKQRIEVATYLIGALERTSVLLSETYTVNSDYSRKRSNIYVAVYTRVSRDIIEEIELPMLMTSGDSKSSASDHDLIETNHLLSSNRVYLPLQTLRQTARESITRISFIMYTKLGSLFKPLQDTLTMDSLLGENNSSTIINSNVISLLLNKDRLPVNAKVRFTLKHVINTNSSNPACVYWDVPSMKWSSSGCELISTNYSHTTCECDHLTNLAVLMQIRDESIVDSDQSALRIITLLGCTISTLCLILTLLSFVLCKSLKGDRIVIHTNLCMCLLIGEVVFLLGIGQTETFLLCRIVALILHYVFLAAFLWMFFESFQLYVMLIEVFESEKSRLPYFYVCSYGIPLAIVSFCYYLDPFSYGTSKHCWLRTDNYFVLSFVGPVVAILMSNLVFLSISLCVMWKQISTVSSVANQNKDESKIKSIRLWLRGALGLVFLLGMTWTFSLLYLNQETLAMAALFTIFNSFQGLFIFIFYCIQNEKVRKEYSKLFASLHCVWNSRAPASSAVESSSANSVVGETRKTVNQSYATTTTIVDNQSLAAHNQEPMIAPNTGSALTPTLRRVTSPAGAKYFITGKADSANSAQENYYGFRRLAEGVRNKQKQRCKAHCDHILKNPLVEHIYECIDDAPYTVTLFAASACCSCRDDLNARLQSEANASECDDRLASADNNSANAFQELKLPAIVCDNSTVISKSNCKAIDSLPYSSINYRLQQHHHQHHPFHHLNPQQFKSSLSSSATNDANFRNDRPLISTVIPTGSKKIVGQPHAVLPSVVGHSNGRTNIVCGGKSSGENNLAAQHAAAEQNGQEAQSHQILAMLGSDNKIVTSCAAVAAMEQGIDI